MNEAIEKEIERVKVEKSAFLDLFNQELTEEIFNEICKLTHLKVIFFEECTFTTIPESIENLINLNSLMLLNCKLFELPTVITKLVKLTRLSISNNKLITLPKDFDRLINLESLDISYNPFAEIPRSILALKKLRELDISYLPVKEFSFLAELPSLEELSLNGSRVSEFVFDFTKLKKLKGIELSNNNFTEFPLSLLTLERLETLNLSENLISYLPDEFGKLVNLQIIKLEKNKLYKFPIQLLNVTGLKGLQLSQNPFSVNELFFEYIIPTNRLEIKSLNFSSLNFSKIHTGEFIYIEDAGNAFLITSRIFNKENLSFLSIRIFGDEKTKKIALRKIRNQIEIWIKKEKIEFEDKIRIDDKSKNRDDKRIAKRYFHYPVKEKNYPWVLEVNYDQLLRLGEAGENVYFDSQSEKKFPVKDLLDYIGIDENELKKLRTKKGWKGTFFLTEVIIDNFKIFNHLKITLSDHFNIILGRNGLGKTSILQGITLGLLPLDNADKSNNFADYISMLHNDDKAEILLSWGEEYRRAYIFKNELNEEEYVNFPQKLILAYGVNLNTDPKLDHSKIVDNIINGRSVPYSTKSIFTDYSTEFHDPLVVLDELLSKRDLINRNTIDSISQLIINALNNYLGLIEESGKIQLESKQSNSFFKEPMRAGSGRSGEPIATYSKKDFDYYFVDINGNQLKTRHLSEGYRDHILLVTDILIRILAARNEIFGKDEVEVTESFFKEVNGVILIDEFDRHLHPVWQRKLLSRFKEDFPKIQFILTTHNPFSVQSAVGANAIELVVEDKTIKTVNNTIESRNILSIIREYFTKDFFDYETQEQMKQFSKYLDEIDEGNTDLAYSQEFKNLVVSISEKSDELKSIIGSQLLQLNATLKKLNHKEFEL